MALLASVLVSGAAALLNDKPTSPDEVFWNAVEEARKMALKGNQDVSMTFFSDREQGKGFLVTDGSQSKQLPIPNPGDLEVSFLSQRKGGSLIMIAGTVLESQPLKSVTFYADGTCTPFRIQFYRGGAAHIDAIDPWTCARLLTPLENAGRTP